MEFFVLVQKLNAGGTPLQQLNAPNHGALMQGITGQGASVLRYKGSNGRLRVSARHLDETLSTNAVPAHTFDRVEKLKPGEIAQVSIDLFPLGLVFYPGEQLRLVVSSHNALGGIMPGEQTTFLATVGSTSFIPAAKPPNFVSYQSEHIDDKDLVLGLSSSRSVAFCGYRLERKPIV